jgi:uncharacterized membrane protein
MSNDKQLERLILFSDAVFAIAITLLILEIKVPHLASETEPAVISSLFQLIPKFVGFIVSFAMIAIFWVVHHRLFGYLVRSDKKLVRNNFFYLFFIVTLPFTTAYYSDYLFLKVPFVLYCANVVGVCICTIVLLNYISDPKNNLSKGLESQLLVGFMRWRSLILAIVFSGAALFQFCFEGRSVVYGRYFLFLMIPMFRILGRVYARKGLDVKSY